jgi:hypothetical protein
MGTILNVDASINVSDFGLIIIMIGKSLLLCMSHGVTSQHFVLGLWTICSNLNPHNWIRIMLYFIGGNVGASAAGSKVLPLVVLVSLQTYKWGCTPGVVPSWKTICGSPNKALFPW